ncbi:MAG: DUF1700 domain-containing protein [Bacilli bacterium]|nr:DUF1700 domain-containing protein [Bacilli bacterium]
MKKEQFLKELEGRLQGLPKKDLEERISFYGEMIDDRIDEGQSEEEAIQAIGTVDEVVAQITEETPLGKLVREKIKPKRSLKAWEIVMLIVGFPLWFPLLLVFLVLILVAYLLIWVGVLVCYALELALAVSAVGGLVVFFAFLGGGAFEPLYLGIAILAAGLAILLFFGCWKITKPTCRLAKKIVLWIKSWFIGKGEKK